MTYPGKYLITKREDKRKEKYLPGDNVYLREGILFGKLTFNKSILFWYIFDNFSYNTFLILTYNNWHHILASVVGKITEEKINKRERLISIIPRFKKVDILSPGDTVYCKVKRVEFRNVRAIIIATEEKKFEVTFEATLQKEHTRSFDTEHANLHEMFRPKDIIKAKVLSVKQAKGNSVVSISTMDHDLGVVGKSVFFLYLIIWYSSWKWTKWMIDDSKELERNAMSKDKLKGKEKSSQTRVP